LKYKKATGSRKKQDLNNCVHTEHFRQELVSCGEEDELQKTNLALGDWKNDLLKEIAEATEKKDAEVTSLNRELSEYIRNMAYFTPPCLIREKQFTS